MLGFDRGLRHPQRPFGVGDRGGVEGRVEEDHAVRVRDVPSARRVRRGARLVRRRGDAGGGDPDRVDRAARDVGGELRRVQKPVGGGRQWTCVQQRPEAVSDPEQRPWEQPQAIAQQRERRMGVDVRAVHARPHPDKLLRGFVAGQVGV